MREFFVSDRECHIRETARIELEALCYFPNDAESFEQALNLIAHELSRWKSIGPDDYRPTELARTVLTSLENRTGRVTLCGLVALAMCGLDNAGQSMSLERAARVVEAFTNSIGKMEFVHWDDGSWRRSQKALIGDFQTIKRVFREYRSVAHICAARVTAADYLEERAPFEVNQIADTCFLSTVLYYQERLRKVSNFDDWNLWEIRCSAPIELRDVPPLTATEDLTMALFRPWLDSQSEA